MFPLQQHCSSSRRVYDLSGENKDVFLVSHVH